jgi:hypothetical protein
MWARGFQARAVEQSSASLMNPAGKSEEKLVDEFVEYVNSHDLETHSEVEIPEELRLGPAEIDGYFNWKIKRISPNPWVQELAQKLPKRFPAPYLSLIERYRFCEFEIGSVMFLANTGQPLFQELSRKTFSDAGLYPTMHKNGFLQFGMTYTGDYDPMCFDMKQEHRGDAPIVRLDHEEILINDRIRVVEKVAPSFSEFMRAAISGKYKVCR